MPEIFKKTIKDRVYTFYRTTLLDQVTYYVMFDKGNQRDSVKFSKNVDGWYINILTPSKYIIAAAKEIILEIEENEKGYEG